MKKKYFNALSLIIIVFLYALVIKYPSFTGYTYDLIPQVNFKEVILNLSESLHSSFIINIFVKSIVFYLCGKVVSLFNCITTLNSKYIDKNKEDSLFIIDNKYDFDRLELSNPFLYANKTRNLLE